MATPVVEGTNTYTNSGATAHTVTLPTTPAAGELLVCVMAWDGSQGISTLTSGWAIEGVCYAANTPSCGVISKTAAGSDSDPVVTLTGSEALAAATLRISGAERLHVGQFLITGNSTGKNLELIQLESSDTHLWMACVGYDGNATVSAYPTNYTGNQLNPAVAEATGAGLGFATRAATAASEDPDSFTLSASEQGVSWMLAVSPEAAGSATSILGGGSLRGGFA